MTLDFTLTEASDNLSVTIQDTTGDWGAGEIADVFNAGNATIVPTILGITYDPINVTSYFENGLQAELAFIITADLLKIGTVAQFESSDFVPDGDWSILYAASNSTGSDSETSSFLVYGVVEAGVLDQLRLQDLNDWSFDNTLNEALIKGAHYVYLKAIINSAYESDINSLREALANLETMLENMNY